MSEEAPKKGWEMDIESWYISHKICPTCGVDFSKQPPEFNLYPHWMGACKEEHE